MPHSAGDRLGPYELLVPIGAGGMGEVWKARDTRLNRTVAIKFSHEKFSERFEREAHAVAALNHPNICQLYDIGPDFLVLEYIEGSPVGPVDSSRKLLDIAAQIADGMSAAHAAGFTHRDLKPDNILITREGRVKILDFGLAKQTSAPEDSDATRSMAITNPGTVLGTVSYMSPEQARAQAVDARSDQFSFGLILYEMAAAKRAFKRESVAETMTAIIKEDAEPLPATVPVPLRWVVERCLAKDPAERYDSTRDLYRELRQVRERLSDIVPASAMPAVAPLPPRRRSLAAWVAAAVLAVAVVVLLFWPIPPSDPPPMIPFATEAGTQIMPAWSPKGDRIAYIADVDGVLQVFTRSLGSSTPARITHEMESCFNPMWSADASRLYYLTGRLPNISLRSIAVAGGVATTVLKGVYRAALSPDGKTLAVFVSDETPGVYRLAFASPPESQPKPYGQAPFNDFRTPGVGVTMQFDPKGEWLGVGGNNLGQLDIFWKLPLNGGTPTPEPNRASQGVLNFTYTAIDDQVVTDDSPLLGHPHLAAIDLKSGHRRPITAGAAHEVFPAVTPDGRNLAFSSGAIHYDVVEYALDGSAQRDVIATALSELAPAWAPDGVRFAYSTSRSGAPEVWLRNRTDSSEKLIAGVEQFSGADALIDLVISPDGSRIAYRLHRGGKVEIWISPLTGEAPVRMWNDPAQTPQRGPSWSPDGNWMAYYSIQDGKAAVMKLAVGVNAAPQTLAYATALQPVRWSPRGDWIAYRDGETMRVVSPDGKQNRVVSQFFYETYGWSKDGARIIGIARGENRRVLLQQVDVDSGRETRLADLGPVPVEMDLAEPFNEFPFRGFSLHPDGKSFLTSVLRVKTQIYLMKDFDRPTRLIDRLLAR